MSYEQIVPQSNLPKESLQPIFQLRTAALRNRSLLDIPCTLWRRWERGSYNVGKQCDLDYSLYQSVEVMVTVGRLQDLKENLLGSHLPANSLTHSLNAVF